jgi:hypothetical protein
VERCAVDACGSQRELWRAVCEDTNVACYLGKRVVQTHTVI